MDFAKTAEALKKLGYSVKVFESGKAAAEAVAEELKDASVGIGGSTTVQELGLYDMLAENNGRVYWHWRVPEGKTAVEVRNAAATADVYISSVNGLAETGEIINIDGTGNRVASTIYGHKKVIFLVGSNKVATDFDSALNRARNIAAPKNAKRLNCSTPCAIKGDKCYNCNSPKRICRTVNVLLGPTTGMEYEVVLIDEPLGY